MGPHGPVASAVKSFESDCICLGRWGPVADPWRDVMIGDGYGFEILQNAAICWQDTLWLFDTMENPKIHH
jgi:hypothetical protein